MQTSAWIVTDGKVGTEKPCRAIAQAMGYTDPLLVTVKPRWPWRYLPASLWPRTLWTCAGLSLPMQSPPQLIVAGSRAAVKPALDLKERFGEQTKVVFWQNPRASRDAFDLIVAPKHDNLQGPNIVETLGAPSLVEPFTIAGAAKKYEVPGGLEGPYVAVLIGGPNKYYDFTPVLGAQLGHALKSAALETGASLLITASRRTPASFMAQLKEGLRGASYYIWDGMGQNPYEAFLGLGSWIVVTQDSISMACDGASTGKGVFVYQLASKRRSKFDVFHRALIQGGFAQPFTGHFSKDWAPKRLDDRAALKAMVRGVAGRTEGATDGRN